MNTPNLREMKVSSTKANPVTSTTMLKGEAKNSLSGTNTTSQYTTSGSGISGKMGGKASYGS